MIFSLSWLDRNWNYKLKEKIKRNSIQATREKKQHIKPRWSGYHPDMSGFSERSVRDPHKLSNHFLFSEFLKSSVAFISSIDCSYRVNPIIIIIFFGNNCDAYSSFNRFVPPCCSRILYSVYTIHSVAYNCSVYLAFSISTSTLYSTLSISICLSIKKIYIFYSI